MVLTLVQPGKNTRYLNLYKLEVVKNKCQWIKLRSGIIYEHDDSRLMMVVKQLASDQSLGLFEGHPSTSSRIYFNQEYIDRCLANQNTICQPKPIDFSAFWRKWDSQQRAITERQELAVKIESEKEKAKELKRLKKSDPFTYLQLKTQK